MATPLNSSALRIVHTGCAGLRLELGTGTVIAIDPARDPGPVSTILLTWNERERLQGALEAVRSGRTPRIAARPEILAWLGAEGAIEATDIDGSIADIQVQAETYRPVPYASPAEALRKLRSGVLDPVRAVRRLSSRARLPSCPPVVLRLQLPGGRTLVHLNCALHRDTPADWLEDLATRWGGADWLLCSWDYDEDLAFRQRVPAMNARCVVITDLVNEVRKTLGLPVVTRTPTADALIADEQWVLMLAARTSLRFA